MNDESFLNFFKLKMLYKRTPEFFRVLRMYVFKVELVNLRYFNIIISFIFTVCPVSLGYWGKFVL